jgi:sugar phosphate isomerase/epimerase
MELAVSMLFCLHQSFSQSLQTITEINCRNIEVVDAGPHTLNKKRVAKLLELKYSYDFNYSVHAPFTDVNISADDIMVREAILKRIETSIDWVSQLDERILVFHPGNFTALERVLPDSGWKHNLESIKRIFTYAENMGVEALLENVPEPFPYIMKSVNDFIHFEEEYGSNFGMVLDIAHAKLREETIDFINKFPNQIRHVHVSDNKGISDEHLPIGTGSIDWNESMKALRESGYIGWITIESYTGIEKSIMFLNNYFTKG